MFSDTAILSLRRVTIPLKRIPGFVFLLELIRKAFSNHKGLVTVRDFDGQLKMKLRLDEHMQSQIFWYGYYSRDIILLMNRILRPEMVVLDVGANIGEITLAAARRVGVKGRVYSFEPMPSLHSRLNEHLASNKLIQVSAICKGLSDHIGRAAIFRADALFKDGTLHDGLGTLYPTEIRSTAVGEIDLETMDSFCASTDISRIDLIKIDVEGAELAVLKGGLQAIKQFQPFIIVEIQTDTAQSAGYTPNDVLSLLISLGYSLFVIGRMARLRALNEVNLANFQNVLCVPAGIQVL